MLLLAHFAEFENHKDIFRQMLALRARQSSQRRGWCVTVKDGLEIDGFDSREMNPLYVCVVSDRNQLEQPHLTGPN